MPQCNAAAVLQRVADALHVAVADLPAAWTSLTAQSTKDAAVDLASILAGKGYSQSQIDQASNFAMWQERIAFVITMQRGSALCDYNQESLKALDPREMIERAGLILVAGVPTAPSANGPVGGVSYGRNAAVTNAIDPDATGDGSWGLGGTGGNGWRW